MGALSRAPTKPTDMISVITPAHKVLPWHNARLINVCSQTSDNWEWVILDNSKDGCVKQYVDYFFDSLQGKYYPQCREKIRVFHEPQFADIPFGEGKMGKICNRLLELTECGDDGFFVRLDFDDFLFDRCLEMLDTAIQWNPDTEFVTGELCNDMIQMENGSFFCGDYSKTWFGGVPEHLLNLMEDGGYANVEGFSEFKEWVMRENPTCTTRKCECEIKIPHTSFDFKGGTVYTMGDGWGMLSVPEHPLCIKKSAFLEKLGGFCTDTSKEDMYSISYPITFDNPVFVQNPCYMRCVRTNNNGYMRSGTIDVCYASNSEYEYWYVLDVVRKTYEKIGFWGRNPVRTVKFY